MNFGERRVSWERRQMYVRRILAELERRIAGAKAIGAPREEEDSDQNQGPEPEQAVDVPEGEIPF